MLKWFVALCLMVPMNLMAKSSETVGLNFEKVSKQIGVSLNIEDHEYTSIEELDIPAELKRTRNRMLANRGSHDLHLEIFNDMRSDLKLNIPQWGYLACASYLTFGLVYLPFSGAVTNTGLGVVMVTTGLFAASADITALTQMLLDSGPKEVVVTISLMLTDEEINIFIQNLDLAIGQLDRAFNEVEPKWYHYIIQSSAPFAKKVEIRSVQILFDELRYQMLRTLQ